MDQQITQATHFSEALLKEADGSWLGGMFSALAFTGGGGAGGHYSLTPDELKAHATEVQSIIDESMQMYQTLGRAVDRLQPPAADAGSTGQASDARTSITAARKHLMSLMNYAKKFHQDLVDTLRTYQEQEHHTAGDLGKQA
ncbi:MAG: hypothetical protein ACRDRL_30290 [Sciscionella sp.]